MPSFQYRALKRDGVASIGTVDATDIRHATTSVRQLGLVPVSVNPVTAPSNGTRRAGRKDARAAAVSIIGELAVLLGAGLQLERALALAIENVENPVIASDLAEILRNVREGAPLSKAFAGKPELFGPAEIAMAEAGEASGQLAEALARLAEILRSQAELRRTVSSALFYPTMLLIVAGGVVLLMLLLVVPQFEPMFASAQSPLPPSSQFVMSASQALRQHGLFILLAALLAGLAFRGLLARSGTRLFVDRASLAAPQLGELIRRMEAARFARTLGALVDGNVDLPRAFGLAQRTIGNQVMAQAVGTVADGIREGSGITAPLAASGALPRIAVGFFRTGEESAQLGPMLLRLSDVLDRDVRARLERVIAIFTPLITALMGAAVAGIIAAIMSAILGFNELAIST